MDRETFHSCCSLEKMPRRSQLQYQPSHFVDYVEKATVYSKFFKNYLLSNQPCMFSKRFTEDWNCRKHWVTDEGKPNFQKLLQEFGEWKKHAWSSVVGACSCRGFQMVRAGLW